MTSVHVSLSAWRTCACRRTYIIRKIARAIPGYMYANSAPAVGCPSSRRRGRRARGGAFVVFFCTMPTALLLTDNIDMVRACVPG